MRKFVIQGLLFLLIPATVLYSRSIFLLWTGKYRHIVMDHAIYDAIAKSKHKSKAKKLIIGDSVANQLFDNKSNSDTLNSLACNQAIALVGHYILLNNYLNAGNEVDTVYLVITPLTLTCNLDQTYTFHNFLKPFNTSEYRPLFTETVKRQIEKIPYHYLSQEPCILTSNWSPEYKSKDSVTYAFLSPISVEYLKKIKELSLKHHFRLLILPTPTRNSRKQLLDYIDRMYSYEISNNHFDEYFRDFFRRIIYIDDLEFVDMVHLKEPQKFKALFIKKCM